MEESLSAFTKLLDNPEISAATLLYSREKPSIQRESLLQTCNDIFREIESLAIKHAKISRNAQTTSLSGLTELHLGTDDAPMDAETIWAQVDLQNEALMTILKKTVKHLSKAADERSTEIRLLEEESDNDQEVESHHPSDDENDAEEGHLDDDDDDEASDEETKRIRQRMEQAIADMEDDGDEDGQDGDSDASDARLSTNKKAVEPDDSEEQLVDPAAEELNDGFFDINEMEAFADEEEEYLPDDAYGEVTPEADEIDKRSFHQRQREGDIGDGESEDDDDDEEEDHDGLLHRHEKTIRRKKYREDDEVDALYKLYGAPIRNDDDSTDDVVNMTAADFFGKPNHKYLERSKSKAKAIPQKEADNDSWDDFNFKNDTDEATGWNDGGDSDDDAESEGSRHDRDQEKASDIHTKDEKMASSVNKSKKDAKLEAQIKQIEKDLLAEKPWQMKGETSSTSRPINSLLESTPEFEVASKLAPIITAEHTMNLEDIIKKRILEEDWDDVVPRELPDVGWHQRRGELPEVSQEKSKLGLGELYEREYLKKAVGYDVDAAEKQTEEEAAKSEMKALFARLCQKLDALSNYHFAPRPIAEEAEVRPVTQPAIAMEEVLPLHVSDARGVAPEEVYGAKRGRDAVLRGDSELEQQERKRIRASKKSARRKARKEKLADERLVSRLQPGNGLNNPYEKRKMREELAAARAQGKVTMGDKDTNEYGGSNTFFQRLQQEAETSIRGQTEGRADGTKTKHKPKSSALKL